MTAEPDLLPELVAEGLDFFNLAGDEGDKLYVRAIRQHIAAKDAEIEALRAEVRDAVAGMNAALDKVIEFRNARHEAEARAERLAEALREAEKSLRTIADLAGGTEYLMTIGDVRGYANSRAYAARAALRDHDQENRND